MNTADVRNLTAYDQWANERVAGAACLLQESQFVQDLGSSFGSVKGTLVHILAGTLHWLNFWQRTGPTRLPTAEDFADARALAAAFDQLAQEQREFVSGLTDELLAAPWRVRDREYPLADLIQHVINHSTYHRGQLATLFRQLGHKPPATDFRLFLDEARAPMTPGGAT